MAQGSVYGKSNVNLGLTDFLPMGSGVLEGLGQYLLGAEDRKFKRKARFQMDQVGNQLETGITGLDIAGMLPAMRKAILPLMNRAAGAGAARYGSGSSYGLGAGLKAGSQAMAPMVAQAWMQRLIEGQRNLRQLHGTYAQLAA